MLQIFRNPYVGIIGSLASIFSLFLAIYFYLAANEKRELTYYVHPAKAALVSADQDNRFEVLFNKSLVKTEVTAATLAFWNAGKKEIRKNDILKPLEFEISGGKPILEAKIIKKSRDVVELNLGIDKKEKGIISIEWNVLEENDGALIQIIYGGSPHDIIEATSIVVGQPTISKLEYPGSIKSAEEQYSDFQRKNRTQGFIFFGLGVGLATLMILMSIYRAKKREITIKEYWNEKDKTIWIQPIVFIVLGIYSLLFKVTPFPPFGF